MLEEKADDPETESEVEEDEIDEYLDGSSSPYHRTSKYWSPAYQVRRDGRRQAREARRNARRNLKRHAMSPPATPHHSQWPNQITSTHAAAPTLSLSQAPTRSSGVRKGPRRPITRSQESVRAALLPEKGMLRYWTWALRWSYIDLSYASYLEDFDNEKVAAEYPKESVLGTLGAYPVSQRYTEYQRKQRLREQKQEAILRNKIMIPGEPRWCI